jgi:hypothetical protein
VAVHKFHPADLPTVNIRGAYWAFPIRRARRSLQPWGGETVSAATGRTQPRAIEILVEAVVNKK